MDKVKQLGVGEQVTGASAILLLVLSFFTWFKKDFGATVLGRHIGGTYNGHNGWGGAFSLLGMLVTIALVTVIVLRGLTAVRLPDKLANLAWPQVYLIAGAAAFVLVLLQVVVGQSVAGVSLDRSIFAYLGVLAAGGVGAGTLIGYRQANRTGGSATS